MTRLNAILDRWKRATKGRWERNGDVVQAPDGDPAVYPLCVAHCSMDADIPYDEVAANALALASAPDDIAWLVAEVQAQTARAEKAEAELRRIAMESIEEMRRK